MYVVRPKADHDLDEQAYYFATKAEPELGHRFLLAAHETFGLLAAQPQIGWHARLKNPPLASLRVFRVSGFEKMIVLYRPSQHGIEILRVVHGSRNIAALLRREVVE
ncbi:MAG: type II toxin-antitoxin system RelE/ParE family toxin [Candidatus Acidiferrales bacterium]